MNDDNGYQSDTAPLEALSYGIEGVLYELRERRANAEEATGLLISLLASLDALESAPVLRKRLRDEIPVIIEALRALGPPAYGASPES